MPSLKDRLKDKRTPKKSRFVERIQTSKTPSPSPLFDLRKQVREEVKRVMDLWKDEIVSEVYQVMTGHELTKKDADYLKKLRRQVTPVKGVDYFDGKNADVDGMVEEVLSRIQIPESLSHEEAQEMVLGEVAKIAEMVVSKDEAKSLVEEIKESFNPKDMAKEIARALETLKGKEKLDYYALKNLPHIPLEDKKAGGKGGGGGMGNVTFKTFTGDGSTTSFTLDNNVASGGNAIIFIYQGQVLENGTHFTVSGKTISTTFTPDDGTTLFAWTIRA